MKTTHPAAIISITAIVVVVVMTVYTQYEQAGLERAIERQLVNQENTLSVLSEITDRNGADATAEQIVRDCSATNRARFENLLNRLNALTSPELTEVATLFENCAAFAAERKALMVARLSREFEVYQSYAELYRVATPRADLTEYQLDVWESLVALEVQRGALMQEQVEIQETIIKALIAGERSELEDDLARAAKINEEAGVLNGHIDEVRGKLSSI